MSLTMFTNTSVCAGSKMFLKKYGKIVKRKFVVEKISEARWMLIFVKLTY